TSLYTRNSRADDVPARNPTAETSGGSVAPSYQSQGLYDPSYEHDACGVALVADLHGRRDHTVVQHGLTALQRLDHRGARGAEPNTGDGAGILLQIPDAFLREVAGVELPPAGAYATGLMFLPRQPDAAAQAVRVFEKYAEAEGVRILGWRDVPTNPDGLGATALATQPQIRQVFVASELSPED